MLKICICDDNESEVGKIQRLIRQFVKEHPENPVHFQSFCSAYDLLEYLEEHGGFDVYLLDILMPSMTGMDLAKRVRERKEKAELLFLTTSREYAVEAFGVKASGYLMKPVQQADFDHALLSCIKNLAPGDNPFLLLKTKEGLRKVPVYNIMFVESVRHSYRCTLAGGTEIEVPGTISSLYQQLCVYPCFYMPHRAFIVNFHYINGLLGMEIVMAGGQRIPVSRNNYTDLKNMYMDYMLQNNKR